MKMTSETSKRLFKEVRPILSLDHGEARRRVISLYKSWARQIPFLVANYDIPFSEKKCKQKLKEEFTKYETIKDVRVIDMLVIRGRMDLDEIKEKWISRRGVCRYFKDHLEQKSDCFMDKFLDGRS